MSHGIRPDNFKRGDRVKLMPPRHLACPAGQVLDVAIEVSGMWWVPVRWDNSACPSFVKVTDLILDDLKIAADLVQAFDQWWAKYPAGQSKKEMAWAAYQAGNLYHDRKGNGVH